MGVPGVGPGAVPPVPLEAMRPAEGGVRAET
jgi:hypothetical protein